MTVHLKGQIAPRTPNKITIVIAVHHKHVTDVKLVASKQIGASAVDRDMQATACHMLCSRKRNAKRCRQIRAFEVIRIVLCANHRARIAAADRNARWLHFQFLANILLELSKLTAAAHKKNCRRCGFVECPHAFTDFMAKCMCGLVGHLLQFFYGYRVFNAQDIGKGDGLLVVHRQLNLFCRVKIQQILLHNGFGNLISRNRRHRIADHAAAARNRNI